MSRKKLSRRQFVAATALTSAALISAPFIRSARAAGKLTMGFWDHWVPGANKASTDLVNEWAAKEKVEVSIDYITSQGNKNLVTIAAEAAGEVRSRHPGDADLVVARAIRPARAGQRHHGAADQAERRSQRHRPVSRHSSDGKWLGVPACVGSQIKGPCSRIDLMKKFANIDVQEMYPAGAPPKADNWTTDTFLKAAEACQQGRRSLRHRARRDLRQCR